MNKQIPDDSPDLTVEYVFPYLVELKKLPLTVMYEHFYPQVGDGGFIDFKIKSIDSFASDEAFLRYVIDQYKKTYSSFISTVYREKADRRVGQLDSLIDDIKAFELGMVEGFDFKGLKHYKFRKSGLAGTKYEWVREEGDVQKKIFTYAESYITAFRHAIGSLLQEIYNLRTHLETELYRLNPDDQAVKSDKESFRYVKYSMQTREEGFKNLMLLFTRLIEKGYIQKDTSWKDFQRIFSGLEVQKHIIWMKRISALHHFIKVLRKEGKLEDVGNRHFKIACNCFVDENLNPYIPENLSEQKSPANSKVIDQLVALL